MLPVNHHIVNVNLRRRIRAFDAVAERQNTMHRPTPLIILVPIGGLRAERFDDLNAAAFEFMARACTSRPRSWADMLQQYDATPPINVTPNGMVVPKRNTVLEYNLVVRAFARVIEQLGIADMIESWHVPLNVRFKSSEVSALNMSRAHPTEQPHSDSWAGESTESVTVHIPIEGDWRRNRLRMFHPDDEFDEAWLGPRPSYADGAEVLHHYEPVDCAVRLGQVALLDFATLHASTREPGCGPRASIDTTFVLRKDGMAPKEHPWREGERASHEVLMGVGERWLMYFPDAHGERVEVGAGFKHPTRLVLVELPRGG